MNRMKKFTLLFLFMGAITGFTPLMAQCTPDPLCVDTGASGQICPESLVDGYVNTSYEQVLTVIPPASFDNNGTIINLSHIKIVDIGNLPPGLTFSTNAQGNLMNTDSIYCVLLSGIPTTTGVYDIAIEVQPYVFNFPMPFTVTDDTTFTITIHPNASSILPVRMDLALFPNPAGNEIFVTIPPDNQNQALLEIFNSIGELVKTKRITQTQYETSLMIEVDDLTRGLYLVRCTSPSLYFSSRFVKD
jgi:hypothetical protein